MFLTSKSIDFITFNLRKIRIYFIGFIKKKRNYLKIETF